MFGYITVNKPEMKIKDFDLYRSFYCGLCRELKEQFGITGQLSLTYDMTFVIMLLSALYESPVRSGRTHCVMHPVRRVPVRKTEITEYCAGMNVLLSYYKCMDDWADERSLSRRSYALLLHGGVKKTAACCPEKAERIREELMLLSRYEKEDCRDLDLLAGCSGRILSEVLAMRQDSWEKSLRKIGFFLGKFIYIMDAYEDVEKDLKEDAFNPFRDRYADEDFEKEVREILVLMLSEACREFEKLPILRYGDILRNILYSGAFSRFAAVSKKRKKEEMSGEEKEQHDRSV